MELKKQGRVRAIKDRIRSQRQRTRKHRIMFPPKGPGKISPLIRIYGSDNEGVSGYVIPDQKLNPWDLGYGLQEGGAADLL